MRLLRRLPILLVLSLAAVAPAAAHSLDELEGELRDREQYFQPVDKPTPDFTLLDSGGERVSPADLLGKVVVLHFIYTSCPDVCPLHADRLADIQAMVNQTPMTDQVRFVTITTDPGNDTPDVLRDFGVAHGLDPVNWLYLTAGPEQPEDVTRNLAEAFGHKFAKTEDGYQIHGVVTHVIDSRGRWRANFHGLKFEPTSLVVFLNALVNDITNPHGHDEPAGVLDWLWDLFGQLESRWSRSAKS